MIPNNDQAMEEIVLPEHLLPLGSVLGQGVSALDLCMVCLLYTSDAADE